MQTCQRVCGRVINVSTEDPKLKEQSIGLFNAAFEADCRLRLNLAEVPQFALCEGEIIVAEGFMDTKKFNVNRIWKPESVPVNQPKFSISQLKDFISKAAGKATQIMVCCGPFTVNNELSYEALKDFIQAAKRD